MQHHVNTLHGLMACLNVTDITINQFELRIAPEVADVFPFPRGPAGHQHAFFSK